MHECQTGRKVLHYSGPKLHRSPWRLSPRRSQGSGRVVAPDGLLNASLSGLGLFNEHWCARCSSAGHRCAALQGQPAAPPSPPSPPPPCLLLWGSVYTTTSPPTAFTPATYVSTRNREARGRIPTLVMKSCDGQTSLLDLVLLPTSPAEEFFFFFTDELV